MILLITLLCHNNPPRPSKSNAHCTKHNRCEWSNKPSVQHTTGRIVTLPDSSSGSPEYQASCSTPSPAMPQLQHSTEKLLQAYAVVMASCASLSSLLAVHQNTSQLQHTLSLNCLNCSIALAWCPRLMQWRRPPVPQSPPCWWAPRQWGRPCRQWQHPRQGPPAGRPHPPSAARLWQGPLLLRH